MGTLLLLPVLASAQGSMLPAAGAINSAMGGAGTAVPNESLGALLFNPALIAGAKGNQISFTTEFMKDDINVRTTKGALTGNATSTSQLGIVPAFGWMMRDPTKKLALGFGLIGVTSIETDYPQDSASVLFAQAPGGLGRVWSSLKVTKIPAAMAYQVTPKLALGASMNIYLGQFSYAPLATTVFDVNSSGDRFYPEAGKPSQRFAYSVQLGFHYQATDMVSVGGSVTTPQNFAPYEWNSTIADPLSRGFGASRTLSYDLDGPMVASFGIGLTPDKKTQIALDGMFTKYDGVAGFDALGWRNVWTFKTGIQREMSEKLVVRAGYHFSQTPLTSTAVLSAIGMPETAQHHLSAGFGLKLFPFLEATTGVSFVPRQHVSGSYADAKNAVGTIDLSNRATSALVGLNFKF